MDNQLDTPEEAARVRALAEKMDFITEDDFRLLADATPLTVQAWRKRGQGPSYVRLGRRYFYPAAAVKKFLEEATRERKTVGAALL